MSRSFRLISAVAVALLLAACGQDSVNPLSVAGPQLDGAHSTGGNRSEGDSTTVTVTSEDYGSVVQTDTTTRTGGHSTGGN